MTAANPFQSYPPTLDGPARRHFPITPADADLPIRPRALKCLEAGTAIVRDEGGTDVTYTLEAGEVLEIMAVQVRDGSTATVVGWY